MWSVTQAESSLSRSLTWQASTRYNLFNGVLDREPLHLYGLPFLHQASDGLLYVQKLPVQWLVRGAYSLVQSLLYPRWRRLVRRDAGGLRSRDGQVWGAPCRWGCTLVAYRSDLLRR